MAIRVLEKHVAELIAAGEVVERPASVVKELAENAIDAGARTVTVELKNGGITYLRVTDNGCGIPADEVRTAFLRHATSKVASEEDLAAIGTLGFRGEALASIAAVARVELLTAVKGSTGVRYCIAGGEEVSCEEAGCPEGTTIIVRDLFYNTPARMKFLKKDVTEANAAAGVVDRIALSHPEVSVRLIRDGRQTLQTPGDGQLRSAIYAVYGREFTGGLIPADYRMGEIRVSGFISAPLAARASRSMQHFFLNGRYVKSKTAMAALEQAYRSSIMTGKFPSCVLNLEMPYSMTDVNVHPAKTEVRFAQEKPVFDAVYYAAKTALSAGDVRPSLKLGEEPSVKQEPTVRREPEIRREPSRPTVLPAAERPAPKAPERPFVPQESEAGSVLRSTARAVYDSAAARRQLRAEPALDILVDDESPAPTPPRAPDASAESADQIRLAAPAEREAEPSGGVEEPEVEVVGEAFETYILAQCGDRLLFIDKHAAHERILFEKLQRGEVPSQLLLEPAPVTLAKEEADALLRHPDAVRKAGFEVEEFGGSAVLVRAVPAPLADQSPAEMIAEIAAGFAEQKGEASLSRLDWLYHNIACRAAIKAGARSTEPELLALARRIAESGEIKYCPHGRPVAFVLTRRELEKQFGRIR